MTKRIVLMVICFVCIVFPVFGQENLLEQLREEQEEVGGELTDTFKGTRLINGQTVELRGEGTLEFLISHRFGRINTGAYSFFGLDESNVRLGLDYAITDRIAIGVGRNSFQKVYDGLFKYKILWQQYGDKSMPVSVVWYSDMAVYTLRRPELPLNFSRRLGYTHQLLISRKFNDNLSLQLSPTLVHRNLVASGAETNGLFALGFGGRYKLTPRTSVNIEYFYRTNGSDTNQSRNALAIGFDIETGGHVFQLHLTNARSMTPTGFIANTSGDFFKGDIHFGFNISRSFQIKETVGKR